MISADELYDVYKENLQGNDAWVVLENHLIEAAKNLHHTSLVFEESFNVQFKEPRKDVKKRLENLGYTVEYARFQPDPAYYPSTYLNKYYISW